MTVTGWPSVAGNAGWPSEPQNLLPPRVEGWPRGSLATATDTERILATAVGWWDAAWYTPGDRWLRNRGVAGELLNMRLGSSLAPNSNDPLFLAPEGVGYCYLPGTQSSALTVPDEAALDITGDLDLRIRTTVDNAASQPTFISKTNLSNQHSYMWRANSNAALGMLLDISPDGTNVTQVVAGASLPYGAGITYWARVTWRASDGRVQFFTAPDSSVEPSSWTQLGSDKTANIGSIYASTSQLVIGGRVLAASGMLEGKVYRAIVKNGIDGTTVLDVDCDVLTSGSQTSFTATTGQTVTIARATSGRKTVAQPARGRGGRALFLLGTDDYMEVQDNWQHQLLNFGQGDSFTVVAVTRMWATTINLSGMAMKSSTADGGYGIATNNSNSAVLWATSNIGAPTRAISLGSLSVYAGVVDAVRSTRALTSEGVTTTAAFTWNELLKRTQPFRVGRHLNTYADMEFTSAAIFRRALTAAEITTLSNYFTNRGF